MWATGQETRAKAAPCLRGTCPGCTCSSRISICGRRPGNSRRQESVSASGNSGTSCGTWARCLSVSPSRHGGIRGRQTPYSRRTGRRGSGDERARVAEAARPLDVTREGDRATRRRSGDSAHRRSPPTAGGRTSSLHLARAAE